MPSRLNRGFGVLNEALRSIKGPTTDWARRALIALRFLNLAWLSLADAVQVAAAAIAVEVLFSRDKDNHKVHSIARRSALVSCHLGCGRTAPLCLCQTATDPDVLAAVIKSGKGKYRYCSAYLDIANLFHDRNLVVHQGQATFQPNMVEADLEVAERALIGLLSWVDDRPGNNLKKMDQILNVRMRKPSG